jgi:hypothetical protein
VAMETTWHTEPVNLEGCAMQDPIKFREYAEECRRIAQLLRDKDREVMLEVARAWIHYAEQQEKKDSER